jgi:hypothetical protein
MSHPKFSRCWARLYNYHPYVCTRQESVQFLFSFIKNDKIGKEKTFSSGKRKIFIFFVYQRVKKYNRKFVHVTCICVAFCVCLYSFMFILICVYRFIIISHDFSFKCVFLSLSYSHSYLTASLPSEWCRWWWQPSLMIKKKSKKIMIITPCLNLYASFYHFSSELICVVP